MFVVRRLVILHLSAASIFSFGFIIIAMIIQADNILSLLQAYPLQLDHYGYGTAGFRYAATFMAPVMVRVGLVSRLLLGQQHMGVMITASHNDESYNGVKISNPDGSMIGPDQESLLVDWVNERSLDKWSQKLTELSTTCTSLGNLHIGRDTRSHSLGFSNLVIQAAEAMAIKVVNHGVVTTPMLHHIVLYSNTPQSETLASRQGYLQQLAQAYIALDKILNPSSIVKSPLQVDGACGVGYQATVDLQSTLTELDPHYADRFQPRNPPSVGPLNHDCGSEHVQKQLKPPTWYDQVHDVSVTYCCSVDGDADRIVFFAEPWTLLDGDKIAVFIAHFFQTLLQQGELPSDLSLGVVQTAYANGASTAYLQVRIHYSHNLHHHRNALFDSIRTVLTYIHLSDMTEYTTTSSSNYQDGCQTLASCGYAIRYWHLF